jgi:GntR family transcriptional regulator
MDIVISNNNSVPIYEQIRRQLRAQILSGQLAPGYCLPPIRVVAAETGISVITVKKAWELLESDGLIHTQASRGCFVAELAAVHRKDKRLELAEEQFRKDAAFYRGLGLTVEEMEALVRRLYGKEPGAAS